MIPKKIHYCWFGKTEVPDEFKKYIDGWKSIMPDYEIIRWDESNYDVYKNLYMKEAYEAKKWGFVPDYARMDILYEHGGIYLDTDVEVLKPFDDLLEYKGFIGLDARGVKGFEIQVNNGSGMGFEKGSSILKVLLDDYNDRHFIKEDGSFDTTPGPNIQTMCMIKKLGLKKENIKQQLDEVTILPSEYFSPYNDRTGEMNITDNTYSIHHYAATWAEEVERYRAELRREYYKRHSFIIAQIKSSYVAYKKYYGSFKMWSKLFERIMLAWNDGRSGR